jgi:Secretion system C-terminal sorting domain
MTLPVKTQFPSIFLLFLFAILFLHGSNYAQSVHILFDATKAEMAGNADWLIDADQTNLGVNSSGPYLTTPGHQSNPQRIPTPAQSGITTGTVETYWTGALSSWGIDCVNRGYIVETLPYNGQITYGNTANAQDLTNYQVYIIDEPNLKFTAAEMTAIMQFVQNGGGLFMISDHNISDRNGDGWDSPHVWNDFLSNNSVHPYPFGIYFDTVDFSQTTTNISATPGDSIIHGPMGNVAKAQWAGGTTMTLDPTQNSTVKGVIYKTGTVPGNTKAMVAYARYGYGKVAAMGDSSPTDDGTGNPTCTLYNGYWADAGGNHRLLLMNITIWLANNYASTIVSNVRNLEDEISVFPNPSRGIQNITTSQPLTNVVISIYGLNGIEVLHKTYSRLNQNEQFQFSLSGGFYLLRVTSDQMSQTLKITSY